MRPECSKTELTKEEYFQLIGLLHLAKVQWDKLTDIEEAVAVTVGMHINDIGDHGHVSDAIWSGDDGWRSAGELMKKLKIQLTEE